MKKLYTTLVAVLALFHISFAQYNNASFLASPNAASLGVYGSIDVTPFTGLPDISVKAFSLKQGDIPVNAELRYFGGGVKPESHPGWVGQNWTLSVGGVVTRKMNQDADEIAVSNFTDDKAFSYMYNYDILNDPSWYTSTYMTNLYPNNSLTFNSHESSPDEFFFTLPNGISGSFFKNHLGKWCVKSKDAGNLVVTVDVNPVSPITLTCYANSIQSIYLKRIIYKITITDQDGVRYTFGNDINSIEFIRPPYPIITDNNEEITANSWYLTQITNPQGDAVNFVYERRENQYVQNLTYISTLNAGFTGCSGSTTNQRIYSSQIITPSYLTEINSKSFKVKFTISPTTELLVPYNYDAFNNYLYGDIYYGHFPNKTGQNLLTASPPKWYQLDEIQILDNKNALVQDMSFIYNDNSNERLFLKKFRKLSNDGSKFYDYNFDYNLTPLPAYNALQCDQWGYYNNKTFPSSTAGLSKSQILGYLDADINYTQAGILTQITYPTGGYTKFEYALNDYYAALQKSGNSINFVTGFGKGGGLRISKITDFDNIGNQYSKQYYYTPSQGTNLSTGILAGNKQIYQNVTIGNPVLATAETISNNIMSDLNYTNGSDVVYSEVKEVLSDGSYNIYKYSNSDNPAYRDEIPYNTYSDVQIVDTSPPGHSSTANSSYSYPIISHISRELERGQLLSKNTYSGSNHLVYSQVNTYRDDAGRFDEYLRSYDGLTNSISCGTTTVKERYIQAVKTYYYFPYLKSSTETTYNYDYPLITTLNNYTYNTATRQLQTKTVTTSKNEPLVTTYHYPNDMAPANDPNGVYPGMVTVNNISPVIEEITSRSGTQVGLNRTTYYSPASGLYKPQYTQTQKGGSDPLEVRDHYSFDANGNLTSSNADLGPTTCYLWGYNYAYPVAQVTGSNYSTVSALVNNIVLQNTSTTDAAMQNELNKIRLGLAGTNAQVVTYTYAPLVGMTSMTDAKGMITTYEYDGFQRLMNIRDKDGNIIKHIDYNYQH